MDSKEIISKLQEIPGHPVTLGEAEEIEILNGVSFTKLMAGEAPSEVRAMISLVTVFGKRVLPNLTMDDVRKIGVNDIEAIAENVGNLMTGQNANPT